MMVIYLISPPMQQNVTEHYTSLNIRGRTLEALASKALGAATAYPDGAAREGT